MYVKFAIAKYPEYPEFNVSFVKVQRNVPITPPSASEASEREQNLSKSHKK